MNVDHPTPSHSPTPHSARDAPPPLVAERPLLREVRSVRRRAPAWFAVLTLALALGSIGAAAIPGCGEYLGLRAGLHSGRANESAAMATLKVLCSAQAQLQASGAIDMDRNGEGEFGYFAELAGVVSLRGESSTCSPALMSRSFGNVRSGRVARSGYWFQIFLPHDVDGWIPELCGGGGGVAVNARRAEGEWLCYAWPVQPGASGNRAFLITQEGAVMATDFAHLESDSLPMPGRYGFRRVGDTYVLAVNDTDGLGHMWVTIS